MKIGRGTRVRTRDLRFWRPSLYQLSYTPRTGASSSGGAERFQERFSLSARFPWPGMRQDASGGSISGKMKGAKARGSRAQRGHAQRRMLPRQRRLEGTGAPRFHLAGMVRPRSSNRSFDGQYRPSIAAVTSSASAAAGRSAPPGWPARQHRRCRTPSALQHPAFRPHSPRTARSARPAAGTAPTRWK